MRRCYFVIPTACVLLESEATPVQHNAFQKRFDLCSSVRHTFSLTTVNPECVLWLLSAAVQLDSVSRGRGGGVFLWLACVGLIHHQSCADVCDCYRNLTYCHGAGQRTDMHKHSNSHKDADRRAHSLIILGPSCEEGLLIWSNATWKIAPSQHTVLKQRHPPSSCSQLQRVCKELPV